MAPSAIDTQPEPAIPHLTSNLKQHAASNGITQKEPLKYSGSLDTYDSFDVTSVIGREFPSLQLSTIVDDDAKIRDLAITGS